MSKHINGHAASDDAGAAWDETARVDAAPHERPFDQDNHANVPHYEAPDFAEPDYAAPDANVPDYSAPHYEASDSAVHDSEVPDYSAPQHEVAYQAPQGELHHEEAHHEHARHVDASRDQASHEEHGEHGEHGGYDVDYAEALPSRRNSRNSRVSKRVRKRRRSLVFFVIVLLFAAVVYFAFQAVKPMLEGFQTPDYPGPGTGSVAFVVPDGATGRSIATDLKSEDIVASEQAFVKALEDASGAASLQPGTFEMRHQMKASDAVEVLLAVDGNKVHYAAVAQNLRIGETLQILAESTGLPVAEFEELANQPALFELPPQAKNLEGYLAPGEYRFPIDIDAKSVLLELVTATKNTLVNTGVTDPNEQFRILTVASIIEFEGNEANYAKISGAIENRINKPNAETGGRLESDATVAYGLGVKTYELTTAEKADKSNPYNTFANPGLPVGPIGSPGIKAIEAAAHPEANPYYFWVTINLDTGETLYAATFAEHQANVAQYVAWCDANQGKCE